MSSQKEIKNRISSVRSTQKITSAMRMVSSAKLHRTQTLSQNFIRYSDELRSVVEALCPEAWKEENAALDGLVQGQAVAVVPVSSNSGLCGAFNSNIAKATIALLADCRKKGIDACLFPIGKKITNELKKQSLPHLNLQYAKANERSDGATMFDSVRQLVADLQQMYGKGEIQQVVLLYHHFQSMGKQIVTTKVLGMSVPFTHPQKEEVQSDSPKKISLEGTDYLTEPTPQELVAILHPKMLNAEVYSVLLDALTSEHAARMLAMQTADDNANELLQELTLLYNKTRQQAITNELIDIMGGKTSQTS